MAENDREAAGEGVDTTTAASAARADGALDVDRAQWLAEILANSTEVIAILDLEARVRYVSGSYRSGEAASFLGRSGSDLVSAESREAFASAFRGVLEDEAPRTIEVRSIRDRWWRVRMAPVRTDGVVRWMLVIASDLTAHRQAEHDLAIKQHMLDVAQDAGGMGLWIWDVAGDVVTWDAVARRVLGWSETGREPTYDDFLALVVPEDRPKVRANVEHALTSGKYRDLDARIRLPDGRVRWILAKGKVLHDEGGRVAQLLGAVTDVTASKEAEAHGRRAQKLEAIGQLAGGVAHDFNNLLVAILGNVDLASRASDERSRLEHLEEIAAAGRRAAELTQQLLAFGRRQQLQPTPVDLRALLDDTSRLLRRLLPETVELSLEVGPEMPSIFGDRGQIEQVLVNLCVNARDAMPTGGRLAVSARGVVADARFHEEHAWARASRYVVIEVSDEGAGIAPAVLDRVFEPFFTTKEHGTGLGLATVYGIVERHGGTVQVESTPGEGTTFRVYLPALEAQTVRAPDAREAAPARGTETILVAEDEDAVRAVVSRLLEDAGYRVLQARDGAEAIELFHRHHGEIRLVLVDAIMPRRSGAEVLAEIRRIAPGVRAIVSSGYATSGELTRLTQTGAALVPKPYEPGTLLRTVRAVLDASTPGA